MRARPEECAGFKMLIDAIYHAEDIVAPHIRWFKKRAKHGFASATPRLATTLLRLAVAILFWILRISNSKQR